MKNTDLYLKPGTYIKASTTTGDVSGISLENFIVGVLNNPTCCPKPPGSPDGMLMTALPLNLTLQTVTDFVGNNSAIQLSTLRLGIRSDSSVTTQVSSVIQATTTNANLVIAPNGTGALIASIPDGTLTGGNARGQYAVDLKPSGRTSASQVASGNYSAVIGGDVSTASGVKSLAGGSAFATGTNSVALGGSSTASGSGSVAIGGEQGGGLGSTASGRASIAFGMANQATGDWSNSLGGINNIASSSYSTVSGGQSNTASTGTNATVVGGQSNTASGANSISGGFSNTASGQGAVSFGHNNNNATAQASLTIGYGNNATANYSLALGIYNQATAIGAVALGGSGSGSAGTGGNVASGQGSFAVGQASVAYLYGQNSTAAYKFALNGDAQQSLLTARKADTLNSAATTVLSLDGTGTTNLIIPNGNNRLWAVKVVATAFVSVAGGTLVLGDSYMGEFTLLFKRVGGTSSVVGVNSANIIYDTNMATAAFTFAAGASQDLQITFKAPTTASATTFRCVAKVELVEVAY